MRFDSVRFRRFLKKSPCPEVDPGDVLCQVLVQKCKYLDETKCTGICIHTCKLPTQVTWKSRLLLGKAVGVKYVRGVGTIGIQLLTTLLL